MTSFHFTTADRRGVRRTWHDFVDEKFGLSSVNFGDEATFSGDIRCSSVGFLTFAEIRATHELAERSRAQVAKARHEHFVVVLLRAGKLKITQAGRECVLSPNTFTLFDCNGRYTFHHVEPTEVLDVIVPAGAMRAAEGAGGLRCTVAIRRQRARPRDGGHVPVIGARSAAYSGEGGRRLRAQGSRHDGGFVRQRR